MESNNENSNNIRFSVSVLTDWQLLFLSMINCANKHFKEYNHLYLYSYLAFVRSETYLSSYKDYPGTGDGYFRDWFRTSNQVNDFQ